MIAPQSQRTSPLRPPVIVPIPPSIPAMPFSPTGGNSGAARTQLGSPDRLTGLQLQTLSATAIAELRSSLARQDLKPIATAMAFLKVYCFDHPGPLPYRSDLATLLAPILRKSEKSADRYLAVALAEPCVAAAVEDGKLNLSDALEIAKRPMADQLALVERIRKGELVKAVLCMKSKGAAKARSETYRRRTSLVKAAKKHAQQFGMEDLAEPTGEVERLHYLREECDKAIIGYKKTEAKLNEVRQQLQASFPQKSKPRKINQRSRRPQ